MTGFHHLTIYRLARENLREVAALTERRIGFGDLSNQLQRSAISVVSNICEGAGFGRSRQFVRFLTNARASNHELQAQLTILTDLGHLPDDHPNHARCDHTGRAITTLIRRLGG